MTWGERGGAPPTLWKGDCLPSRRFGRKLQPKSHCNGHAHALLGHSQTCGRVS